MKRPPIEYAKPSTRQPSSPLRWYQLDYAHRDLALILAFLAIVLAIGAVV